MDAHADTAQVAALADKIKPVRFAMFTTRSQDGHLVSQPMTRTHMDEHGGIWFYTSILTGLWENIAHDPEVNLAFTAPDESLYVSVSGTAERVVDRARIHAFWNPLVAAWFPNGPEDEHAVLVRVSPHGAEYWDANDSKMVRLFQVAKAAVTGTPPEVGAHGTIRL